MTLDIEMPRMDGLKFLKRLLPQYPLPVIMISSLEDKADEAIAAGAAAYRVKPDVSDHAKVNAFISSLAADITRLGEKNSSQFHTELPHTAKETKLYNRGGIEIVALGASTGGTDALEKVIKDLPKDCPPVIVTQHMPPVFTQMYAERLNRSTSLAVFEATDGMRLKKGMCVIAAGGFHMELHKATSCQAKRAKRSRDTAPRWTLCSQALQNVRERLWLRHCSREWALTAQTVSCSFVRQGATPSVRTRRPVWCTVCLWKLKKWVRSALKLPLRR